MLTKEKFNGFTYQDNQKYKQAAIDMYGKEAIEEAIEKQNARRAEAAQRRQANNQPNNECTES